MDRVGLGPAPRTTGAAPPPTASTTSGTDLAEARLNRANLATAALAVIAATRDGEPDALSHSRDELQAQGGHADNTRGSQ